MIAYLGLMIWPSKYINAGGYGFLFSVASVALLMMEKREALHTWIFWFSLICAIGCTYYWLVKKLNKNEQ